MGGSAKANANFGPGLYEMETISFSQVSCPTDKGMKEGRGTVTLHDHFQIFKKWNHLPGWFIIDGVNYPLSKKI